MLSNNIDQTLSISFLFFGQSCWGIGALTALIGRQNFSHAVYSTILFVGSVFLIAGVVAAWPNDVFWCFAPQLQILFTPLTNRLDALASVFLILLGTITAAVALYSPGYLALLKGKIQPGLYWFCIFAFVFAMARVIICENAIFFLVFWELMGFSATALIVSGYKKRRAQNAALIYLGASRVSTAFLTGGFLWFYMVSGSWHFSDWRLDNSAMLAPEILIFIGLAIKAGLWPFHSWLPYVYPAAPAPVAALMGGMKIKVAIYAMIRFMILGGFSSEVFAYSVLALGVISASWGILFALVQPNLKRLLAYSSVENVGLIVTGLAASILGRAHGLDAISSLALAATLLHCINHGIFKSLLFMITGSVESAVHTTDLSLLGGLSKRMPWTLAAFFVAAFAISAMPPLNGFASKWLLYQSYFQLAFQSHSVLDRTASYMVIGILALVGAMSVACFAKAVGIGFLGRPRSDSVTNAQEVSLVMIVPQIAFALLCIGAGVFASEITARFAPILGAFTHTSPGILLTGLPIKPIAIGGTVIVGLLYLTLLNRKKPALRQFVTWDCGYGNLPSRAEETGSSFSQPIAILFRNLLQYRVISKIEGKDRRHFPDAIQIESSIVPITERYLYRPFIGAFSAAFSAASKGLVRLQTGSIHIHLIYVFVTILILIWLGTKA